VPAAIRILEKARPTICQLGNDLLNVRYVALNAPSRNVIVFPSNYFGRIFEAQTAARHGRLQRQPAARMLQETNRRDGPERLQEDSSS